MLNLRFVQCTVIVALFAGAMIGCAGPHALRKTRQKYNEAIQLTAKEELLLNLVRLRYREPLTFLELQNLATQYAFENGASLNSSLIEYATTPDSVGFGTNIGFADRPTVSYGKLQGSEFVQKMVAPLSFETITLLIKTGWAVDRILQMTAQKLTVGKGRTLLNAPRSAGPTPDEVPEFAEFKNAVAVLRQLQIQNALEIGFKEQSKTLSAPIPANSIKGVDVVAAADKGWQFNKVDGKNEYVLTGKAKKLMIRATGDPRDPLVAEASNRFAEDLFTPSELKIEPRSVVGAMYYLSHVIQVPPEHEAKGLVTVTRYPTGEEFNWSMVAGNLFCVCSKRKRPHNAYVAVRYRGHWFYIPDDNRSAKATFALLMGLFELQSGGGIRSGAPPVLTLSVGR